MSESPLIDIDTVEINPQVMVYMSHVRAAKQCSSGAREWFVSRGLNYSDFLRNGLKVEVLEALNDELANIVCREARKDHALRQQYLDQLRKDKARYQP